MAGTKGVLGVGRWEVNARGWDVIWANKVLIEWDFIKNVYIFDDTGEETIILQSLGWMEKDAESVQTPFWLTS